MSDHWKMEGWRCSVRPVFPEQNPIRVKYSAERNRPGGSQGKSRSHCWIRSESCLDATAVAAEWRDRVVVVCALTDTDARWGIDRRIATGSGCHRYGCAGRGFLISSAIA